MDPAPTTTSRLPELPSTYVGFINSGNYRFVKFVESVDAQPNLYFEGLENDTCMSCGDSGCLISSRPGVSIEFMKQTDSQLGDQPSFKGAVMYGVNECNFGDNVAEFTITIERTGDNRYISLGDSATGQKTVYPLLKESGEVKEGDKIFIDFPATDYCSRVGVETVRFLITATKIKSSRYLSRYQLVSGNLSYRKDNSDAVDVEGVFTVDTHTGKLFITERSTEIITSWRSTSGARDVSPTFQILSTDITETESKKGVIVVSLGRGDAHQTYKLSHSECTRMNE